MESSSSSSSSSGPHFWGPRTEEQYYAEQGIDATKSMFTFKGGGGGGGGTLFTRSWRPSSPLPPRALVCMIHGYGNDTSWTFQSTPIFLAQKGFACFAPDLPGHGCSQGLPAFIPDINVVVDALTAFFDSVTSHFPPDLPRFLYGESMGGALCLLIHLRNHHPSSSSWSGAVLVAPMCRISDRIRPPWPLPQLLTFFARLAPTLPIVPTADLVDKSVKVEAKRALAAMNPMRYNGKPRLGTVQELLRVTDELSGRLSEVTLPFLVLHGSADVVTDPEVSQDLHDAARSQDKTIRIYQGMMHSLLFGETDENVALVREDILTWLNQRSTPPSQIQQQREEE